MKVEVDLDAVAQGEIARLKKEVTRQERRVRKLEAENIELRSNRREVKAALSRIQAFAADLPNNWESW